MDVVDPMKVKPKVVKQVSVEQVSEEFLRSAKPRLITQLKLGKDKRLEFKASIGQTDCDEVWSEGYDPDHSPLRRPVYWRHVRRGDAQFNWSTYAVTRDEVLRGWGKEGLAYCDPITGLAIVRMEQELRPDQSPEDWEEAIEEQSREKDEEHYQLVLKYIAGKIVLAPGTVARHVADDVMKQVAADPGLLAPENSEKLRALFRRACHDHDGTKSRSPDVAAKWRRETAQNQIKPKRVEEASAEWLCNAQPHLIVHAEFAEDSKGKRVGIGSAIRQADDDGAGVELRDEYFNADFNLLGRPAYWRLVKVAGKDFSYSTFAVTRDEVRRVWGDAGEAYCDPTTGLAVARIEARLPVDPGPENKYTFFMVAAEATFGELANISNKLMDILNDRSAS
jgi:hypothetical protein